MPTVPSRRLFLRAELTLALLPTAVVPGVLGLVNAFSHRKLLLACAKSD